jgi:hypothetical protein
MDNDNCDVVQHVPHLENMTVAQIQAHKLAKHQFCVQEFNKDIRILSNPLCFLAQSYDIQL